MVAFIEVQHLVTADEVAAGDLLGHFTERGQEWVTPPFPIHGEIWPISLKSAYMEISRGGYLLPGIHLQIYHMLSSVIPAALYSGQQGFIQRARWYGDLPCYHGVGVLIRAGVLAENDTIAGGMTYERI